MTDREQLRKLLDDYVTGRISATGQHELLRLLNDPATAGETEALLQQELESGRYDAEAVPEIRERLHAHLDDMIRITRKEGKPERRIRRLHFYRRCAAAAVILLLAGAGIFFWRYHSDQMEIVTVNEPSQDIEPGGNKAVLTLSNGRKIILDNAHTGQLASQGSIKIVKVDSGLLAYRATLSKPVEGMIQYNTLTTPRGGQYRLVLPDGSKVWLNAASSIRYPTAFTGKERVVEMTGEAYFEVKHDSRMPFKVKAAGELIEDVGTHFNVNAYADELVLRTTVTEGSVRISNIILQHGEQAVITSSGRVRLKKGADVAEAIAWTNGNFYFRNTGIKAIMRQLARWYDAEVQYEGDVDSLQFSGIIPRRQHITRFLEYMQATATVHFKIKGRKVIVMPGKAPPAKKAGT